MNTSSLIIIDGNILSMDEFGSTFEALHIKGNKINCLGTNKEILKNKDSNTVVISARGGTVLPGFIDSHVHLFPGSSYLNKLNLMPLKTFSELKDLIFYYIENNPSGTFVFGRGANYQLFNETELETRKQLDQISTKNPILVQAPDGHTAWANTKALKDAGILEGITLPVGNEVVMSSDGFAEGMLKENEAIRLVLALAGSDRSRLGLDTGGEPNPPASDEEKQSDISVLKSGLSHLAKLGITSIHNMDGNFYTLELLDEIRKSGKLTCRVKVPFHFKNNMRIEQLEQASIMSKRWNDEFLSSGFVKFFMDGVLDSSTAFLIEDYADQPGVKGEALFEEDEFNELVIDCDNRSLQIAVHSIGDGAVQRVLNAYENAQKVNGVRDSRHRVEHIELIQKVDIKRFKDLNVIASMQPVHPPGCDGLPLEPTISKIGVNRYNEAYAWRSIKEAGGTVTFSTDWPVSNVDPINAISNALNREKWSEDTIDQRLSLIETLRAYTIEGSYAEFKEHSKGILKEGYLADIVILSEKIDRIPTNDISKIEVINTIIDGKIVYSRD